MPAFVFSYTVEGVLGSVEKARRAINDSQQRDAADREREKNAEEATR